MRVVAPWQIKAGNRYKIVQNFLFDGTTITYEGTAMADSNDDYVYLRKTGIIDCHTAVGMDVTVYEYGTDV